MISVDCLFRGLNQALYPQLNLIDFAGAHIGIVPGNPVAKTKPGQPHKAPAKRFGLTGCFLGECTKRGILNVYPPVTWQNGGAANTDP
jgi:hypothetical protein